MSYWSVLSSFVAICRHLLQAAISGLSQLVNIDGLYFLLLSVSCLATFFGFLDFITDDSGACAAISTLADLGCFLSDMFGTEGRKLVYALLASIAIVGVMAIAIETAQRQGFSAAFRGFATFVYLFMACFSIMFGYTFFWKLLSAEDALMVRVKGDVAGILASFDQGLARADAVNTTIGNTESFINGLARSEENDGGVCDDSGVGKRGLGPKTSELRKIEAELSQLKARSKLNQWGQCDNESVWYGRLCSATQRLRSRIQAVQTPESEVKPSNETEGEILKRLRSISQVAARERATRLKSNIYGLAEEIAANARRETDREFSIVATELRRLGTFVSNNPVCRSARVAQRLLEDAEIIRSPIAITVPPFPDLEQSEGTSVASQRIRDWSLAQAQGLIEALPRLLLAFRHGLEIAPAAGAEGAGSTVASAALPTSKPKGLNVVLSPGEAIALFAAVAVDLGILFVGLVRFGRKVEPSQGAMLESQRRQFSDNGRLLAEASRIPVPLLWRRLHDLLLEENGAYFIAIPEPRRTLPADLADCYRQLRQLMLVLERDGLARNVTAGAAGHGWIASIVSALPLSSSRKREYRFERELLRRHVPSDGRASLAVYEVEPAGLIDLLFPMGKAKELETADGVWPALGLPTPPPGAETMVDDSHYEVRPRAPRIGSGKAAPKSKRHKKAKKDKEHK